MFSLQYDFAHSVAKPNLNHVPFPNYLTSEANEENQILTRLSEEHVYLVTLALKSDLCKDFVIIGDSINRSQLSSISPFCLLTITSSAPLFTTSALYVEIASCKLDVPETTYLIPLTKLVASHIAWLRPCPRSTSVSVLRSTSDWKPYVESLGERHLLQARILHHDHPRELGPSIPCCCTIRLYHLASTWLRLERARTL